METIVDKIHNEFDTAVDRLIDISSIQLEKAESIVNPDINDEIANGEFLRKIGFDNVDIAIKSSNYKSLISSNNQTKEKLEKEAEGIQTLINKYSNIFPFHKFILYSQVISILEKYNLYLGHSTLFKGKIPAKNIEEIKNFPFDKAGDVTIDLEKPLCANDGNARSNWDNTNLFICAPKKDFILRKSVIIGHEIVKGQAFKKGSYREFKEKLRINRMKDPIILLPVRTMLGMLGFIIVTKWGKEAEDSSLVVPRNN